MNSSVASGGIAIEGASKVYPGGVVAVDDVSLDIGPGEFMVLVGSSGCGKTTLLRMVAGLEAVSSGVVRLDGREVTNASARTRDIAMVFQNYALYPQMSIADNLAFALRMRKVPKATRRARVAEIAQVLGLTELLERKPAALSGGQRQRVAMGRAMVRQPRAYLMDEPLSNLDAKLRAAMRGELARLHEQLGVTTMYVTHDQVEAMTLGHRVAVMRDGIILQCGDPQTLFDAPSSLFVAAFLGSPPMNLVEATVSGEHATFADVRVPLPRGLRMPSDRVIVGFRPADLTLSSHGGADWPQLTGTVEVIERLGSESHVSFPVDVPRLDTHVTATAGAVVEDEAQLIAEDRRARLTARVLGRDPIEAGGRADFRLDPSAVHYFDPASEQRIG